MPRDEADVKKLVQQIKLFNPFGRTCEELIFISTNAVASNEIRMTFYQLQCVVQSFSQTC